METPNPMEGSRPNGVNLESADTAEGPGTSVAGQGCATERSPTQWITLDDVKSAEYRDNSDDRRSTGSCRSVGSNVSSSSVNRLKEARVKAEIASLKRVQLERRRQLEKEMKECEQKIEMWDIHAEQERADTEIKLWEREVVLESEGAKHHLEGETDGVLPIRAKQSSNHEDYIGQRRVSRLNPTATEWKKDKFGQEGSKGEGIKWDRPRLNGNNNNDQFTGMSNQSLNAMLNVLNFPKPEIITFTGDSSMYWNFINSFETNIESKGLDDRTRLTYLIQFCSGVAKESIEDCVLMPPTAGFRAAKNILSTQFGQTYQVTNALLSKVLNRDPVKPNEGKALWDLARQMRKCQITLNQLGQMANMNSTDTLIRIQHLLPLHMQTEWAKRAHNIMQQGREPQFTDMTEFVEYAAHVANNTYGQNVSRQYKVDRIPQSQRSSPRGSLKYEQGVKGHKVTTLNTSVTQPSSNKDKGSSCLMCHSGSHHVSLCYKFKKESLEKRVAFVRANKLCNNCLEANHFAKGCIAEIRCTVQGCHKKHNTLLHYPNGMLPGVNGSQRGTQGNRVDPPLNGNAGDATGAGVNGFVEPQQTGTAFHASKEIRGKVCLRALPVKVKANDREIITWALLDDGSDVSLCDKRLVELLGLKGQSTTYSLNTIMGTCQQNGVEVSIEARGLKGDGVVDLPKVWSVDRLPISGNNLPTVDDITRWPHLKGIDFPKVDNDDIMLLIGSDTPEAFWVLEERRGRRKQPFAIRCLLGWTLMGPMGTGRGSKVNNVHNICLDQLDEQVARLWETDFGDLAMLSKKGESQEDKKAKTIMEESVNMIDGHYEIDLPWRNTGQILPNNRHMADKRLQLLKRRLEKDKEMGDKYAAVITDYIEKGYAKRVPINQLANDNNEARRIWYLPHHPVLNPQKPDKLRVVFDCAATFKGISLNDCLLQGPDFTNSLTGVLIRFRQSPVALVGDIEAMFHQVRVTNHDQDALRFLWWPDGDLSQKPIDYQMCAHVFGATSSPSCAGFALRKVALDHKEDFDDETINTVLNNFYVDDCLKSIGTPAQAIRLVCQLQGLLKLGGFKLTKWVSNHKGVMELIPQTERAKSVMVLPLDKSTLERTLGVKWDIKGDFFTFRISQGVKPVTRRGILSTVSSLYDPLGFVGPFVLTAKLLLQDICRQGFGWDEEIPEVKVLGWDHWLADLPGLSGIAISRCYIPNDVGRLVSVELHTFSDASEKGYAAVSYLRTVDVNSNINCAFIIGKTRLSPLKVVTIPRLELTAAVLAVQLGQLVQAELQIPLDSVRYWTDSTSVLQYIQNESRRFHTFVANRVSKIRGATNPSQWYHVRSEMNPADEGSRGLYVKEMVGECQWLHGPKFLWNKEDQWPISISVSVVGSKGQVEGQLDLDNDPEVKGSVQACQVHTENAMDRLLKRYSTWNSLRKAVAWLTRYKYYLCDKVRGEVTKTKVLTGSLSLNEILDSEQHIIRYVQRNMFPEMFKVFRTLPASDKTKDYKVKGLKGLSPILVDGVMRVGGRIRHAPVDEEVKHPIIMPKCHHVTDVIIAHYHLLVGHSGASATWASLRQKYWVIQGGVAVRRLIGKCLKCMRRNATFCEQQMADLPYPRVTPSNPPFTYTGVDYFGPLYVRQGRSHVKRYGCLFTCLTIRAVHVEISHALDTDSFLNSLRRFVSRRGTPKCMYSDNGTNFVGGNRELQEGIMGLNQQKISDYSVEKGIEWHFNPPLASHMGGVWERMVRSVRRILKSMLGEQVVTDEVLLTVMAEVESILNSRPLTGLTNDPLEEEPLTPNHLLLLRANYNVRPGVFKDTDGYGRRAWRQAQYLADQFWHRWLREYLPILQLRQKWTQAQRNLEVGDLVLVATESAPRGQWPLGRVVQVYPDDKGLVRQVEVKVRGKLIRRPIVKLCLLEIN